MASGGLHSNIPRLSNIKCTSNIPQTSSRHRSRSQSRPSSSIYLQARGKRSSSVGGSGVRSRSGSAGQSLGGNGNTASIFRQSIARLSGNERRTKKDLRNLNDKDFQRQNIEKMRMFLVKNKFDRNFQPVTSKLLHSPSASEFYSMFEFLYQILSKNFQLKNKNPSEEIISICKSLHYPYTINKSQLLNPGSRQSWAHLLPFLCWLADLIEYCKYYKVVMRSDKYQQFCENDDIFGSNETLLEIIYNFINETFWKFAEKGQIDEQDKLDLENIVDEYMGISPEDMEKMENQCKILEEDLRNKDKDMECLKMIEASYHSQKQDLENYQKYNDDIQVRVDGKLAEIQTINDHNAELLEKVLKAKKKHEDIKGILKSQEDRGLNSQLLLEKKKQLNIELADWEEKLSNKNQKKWNREMEQLSTHAQFRHYCSSLEDFRLKIIEALKDITTLFNTFPYKEKLNKFLNYSLFLSENTSPTEIMELQSNVPSLLASLRTHISHEGSWKVDEFIRKIENAITELEGQYKLLQIEVKDIEDYIRVNKTFYETEISKICVELDTLQDKIAKKHADKLTLSEQSNKPLIDEDIKKLQDRLKKKEKQLREHEAKQLKGAQSITRKQIEKLREFEKEKDSILEQKDNLVKKIKNVINIAKQM